MLARQQFLPRLPLPKLDESLNKFLRASQPLLSAEEFAETKEAVADFIHSGVGEKLQAHLERRDNNPQMYDSWLIDYYNKHNFLTLRNQPLFNNPSMAMPPQKFNSPDDQFRFAAGVISSALEYRAKIIDQDIKPESAGKDHQLCMNEYNLLFDNARIPKIPTDLMVAWERVKPFQMLPKDAEVVIMYRNRFFNLKVSKDSSDPQSIYDSLLGLKEYRELPFDKAIGILTTWDRDNWSNSLDYLEDLTEMNSVYMEILRRSAFVVCLDTMPLPPVNSSYGELHRTFDQVLHGGGSALNSGNRWFDKAFQLIIGVDGVWGAAYEHTSGEAFIITGLLDHIAKVNCKRPAIWKNLIPQNSTNLKLEYMKFEINAHIERDIAMASEDFDPLVDDLDSHVNFFQGWGRRDALASKLPADSMVQMALQLAFYRLRREPGSCYETGSLRRFYNSRTEIIRSCTNEAMAMCHALTDNMLINAETARDLVSKALKSHSDYLRAACSGKGFDRHLFALKAVAVENAIALPALYSSPGYNKLMHMVLSTSQVTMETDYTVTGYVPGYVKDGYSCCYSIGSHNITAAIMSWKSCPTTDTMKFVTAFNDALSQLIEIASSGKPSDRCFIGGAKL